VGALGKPGIISWSYIEQSRGVYDWSYLDAAVAFAQANNQLDFMFYTFDGTPQWATSDPTTCRKAFLPGTYHCAALPTDMTDLDNFVNAMLQRYAGKIRVYELMNEPTAVGIKGMTAADLATFAQRVYGLIRAFDPAIKIAAPNFALRGNNDGGIYNNAYYDAGGPRGVDYLTLHGYPSPTCEATPESIDTNFVPRFGGNISYARFIPTIIKYGLTGITLWDTEVSWEVSGATVPHSGGCGTGPLLNSAQKAMFAARSALLHWSNDMRRMYWYAYTSIGTGDRKDTAPMVLFGVFSLSGFG
jgi:hypothetical protein